MYIKQISTAVLFAIATSFAWAASDYKEHTVTQHTACDFVRELQLSNNINACHDSINAHGNFRYKATGGFATDHLNILPSASGAPTMIKESEQRSAAFPDTLSQDERRTRAIESGAVSLRITAVCHVISISLGVVSGIVLLVVFQ